MPTYTLIMPAVVVGSGGAATISFSSIPSTYTDLILKLSTRDASASIQGDCVITFNGVGSGYSQRVVYGSGTGTASITETSLKYRTVGATATASTFDNTEIYIPNYAGSTNKSVSIDNVTENNASAAFDALVAGLWSNTAAITSITITPGTANFQQYSTAYLYGVSNA